MITATPDMVNEAFIGDRLVDTARAIGVFPSLMATAMIPMIENDFPVTRQIECTSCVMSRKQKAFISVARKMGIEKMVLEKSPDPGLDPSTIAQDLEEQGFQIEIADFSTGTLPGILDTARVLDRGKAGEKTAAKYEKKLNQAKKALPQNLGKKVLVLLGMRQPGTDKDFLLVEEHGSFEQAVLAPTGCTNVAGMIKKTGEPTDDYDIRVIHNLDGLVEAAPDFIALTCEAGPGLVAIRKYVTAHPKARQVPAISGHAIFNLPHCCGGSPMRLPHTLTQWAKALEIST